MDDGWIVIPRWDEFQHRDMARSTVPPWIKVYTKLESDDDFRRLTFAERGLLLSTWLAHATSRRQLRHDHVALTRRYGQTVRHRQLDSLIDAGWIELSASRPAGAHASNLASLEVEVEPQTPTTVPARSQGLGAREQRLKQAIALAELRGEDVAVDWIYGLRLSVDEREQLERQTRQALALKLLEERL